MRTDQLGNKLGIGDIPFHECETIHDGIKERFIGRIRECIQHDNSVLRVPSNMPQNEVRPNEAGSTGNEQVHRNIIAGAEAKKSKRKGFEKCTISITLSYLELREDCFAIHASCFILHLQ